MLRNPLRLMNISAFLQAQIFLLPVLLLFYQHNGLTVGDFFLFQGIFSIAGLLFEVPAGYLGDIYPKKNILILSYLCFIVRLLLWLFFAHLGYWIILAGEILYAAQKALFSGIADGYIYEYLRAQNKESRMLKRYGKINSFLSIGTAISSLFGAYCYHILSKWSMATYQKDYGFLVLIIMEIILNVGAVGLLFLLPQIPCQKQLSTSLKARYIKFFDIIVWTFKNSSVRYHILLSGILTSVTMVFVWNFQPMLKFLAVPVSIYGFVYFINHACRALFSYKLNTTMKYISLPLLGLITVVAFTFCFIISIAFIYLQPLPLYLNLLYFIFVSLTIGFQLSFGLANISRIHHIVSSDIRSTVSSINTAIGRLCSGLFLILIKFLISDFSEQISLGICFAIFMISFIPLRHVFIVSRQEQYSTQKGVRPV